MEDLAAGGYTARVKTWKFDETKENKKMRLSVNFLVNGTHSYWWQCYPESTSEKYQENWIKALRVMGYQGNDLDELVSNQVDALDTTKDVHVALEYEEGTDGKLYPKIQWVNEINKMDDADALSRVKKLNLKAAFMAQKPKARTEATHTPTKDEIPF